MKDLLRISAGLCRKAGDKLEKMSGPRVPLGFDLFAGCGGMSCGMHQAGWHIIAALEWSVDASLTYLANLGSPDTTICFIDEESKARWMAYGKKHEIDASQFGSGWIKRARVNGRPASDHPCKWFFFGDIRKLNTQQAMNTMGIEPGELDCIAGGPPCQGFSHAGKRQVMDFRNSLVFEYCRMVVDFRPKTTIMENVPGIQSMNTAEGISVIDSIALILQEGGFSTFDAIRRSLVGMPKARGIIGRNMEKMEKAKGRRS